MKVNEDLLIYTVIKESGNEDGWEISSNMGKKGYYIPYIENKSINFFADAEDWILNTLYINLTIMIEAKQLWIGLTDEIIRFRKEEIPEIPINDYEIIVDLIEQAIELGFFREYYDKIK